MDGSAGVVAAVLIILTFLSICRPARVGLNRVYCIYYTGGDQQTLGFVLTLVEPKGIDAWNRGVRYPVNNPLIDKVAKMNVQPSKAKSSQTQRDTTR